MEHRAILWLRKDFSDEASENRAHYAKESGHPETASMNASERFRET